MVNAAVTWTAHASDGRARAGTLKTPHGSIDTPTFMAVGTLGGLKGVTADQARNLGQGILLANTYHLALRPTAEIVHKLGQLHTFSNWHGPMLTDSGGYQVFSLAAQRKISEEGVTFRSHIDGARLQLTPEESIRIQRLLGADIIMAFDECPPAEAERDYHKASMDRTIRWLDRSITAWLADSGDTPQALFGIIQGGLDLELRDHSLKLTTQRDVPGFAIGGLAVGESPEDRNGVLSHIVHRMPADKPRYLMGVGTPLDLLEAVERGVDMFDCVLPTRMGRHGIAYTDAGPMHIKRAEYAADIRPIDDITISEAHQVSRGYIRHLMKCGEALGGQLVSIHNLAYYQQLMQRMRQAIKTQTFNDFAQTFRTTYDAKSAEKPDS